MVFRLLDIGSHDSSIIYFFTLFKFPNIVLTAYATINQPAQANEQAAASAKNMAHAT
jgi:hypothetical protein